MKRVRKRKSRLALLRGDFRLFVKYGFKVAWAILGAIPRDLTLGLLLFILKVGERLLALGKFDDTLG